MAKEIFISYRSEEALHAQWVKSILEINGFSCWMAPDDIPGGSNYANEIPNAIENAKAVVLILSKKAQKSKWVAKEVSLAFNCQKPIMPFMIENFVLNKEFNMYLTDVQRFDAYHNKQKVVRKMIDEICRVTGKEPIPPEKKIDRPPVVEKAPEQKKEKSKIEKAILFITPYGRKQAENPRVKFPLHIMSIMGWIIYFPLLVSLWSAPFGFVRVLITVSIFLAHWYICYGACIVIGNYKTYNKFLAAASAVSAFFLLFLVLLLGFGGLIELIY